MMSQDIHPRKGPIRLRKAEASDAAAIASIHLGARKRYLAFAPMVHSEAEVHA